MTITKSISVVIPNYNGEQLLQKNLPVLYTALTTACVEYEIIIPDDASTDNSIVFLQNNYPDIIIIPHKINQGFSTNINAGIRKATKELIFLLNSDIELTPDFFPKLLPYFDNPSVFGVSGRIIGLDSDTIQDSAKYPQYSFGIITSTKNYLHENVNTSSDKVPSFFLAGSNALVDAKKLKAMGGFSEIYSPFYFEDVDLGLRAWRLGYTCYYEHQAICRHPNSVTIKKYNSNQKVKIIAKRNKFYLHYIHLNGPEQYFWFIKLLLNALGRLVIADLAYVKSVKQFLATLPAAKTAKKDFSQLQKAHLQNLSVRDVYKKIKTEIGNRTITTF